MDSGRKPGTEFWACPLEDLLRQLRTAPAGLSTDEAERRLAKSAASHLKRRTGASWRLLLAQFRSPITLLLIAAALLSWLLRDATNSLIILAIVLASALLGFFQENGAANALDKLLAVIETRSTSVRDGRDVEVPTDRIVPGDIVRLAAGDAIPGDARLIGAQDLILDEAALTGESWPVEKHPAALPPQTPLAQRTNVLFLGTHVVSGSGLAVVVRVGRDTEFGAIAGRLQGHVPETAFERGVRRFGGFLVELTLVMLVVIFAANALLHRPILDSFLFALALAVGLTPQLLPAIISVNLSHGARRMALRQVIVRRLISIENFGSMDVLCSDKTGTLTEGRVRLRSAVDPRGSESEQVLYHAWLNATHETGFRNPIDEAIRALPPTPADPLRKLDEIPYDFQRRRLSILVDDGATHRLIAKGAVENILAVCDAARLHDGTQVPLATLRDEIDAQFRQFSEQGSRTLGVAVRDVGLQGCVTRDDEREMDFLGFLVLEDPPKPGITETLKDLSALGIRLKMLTGDNRLVARHVAQTIGLPAARVLTGGDLRQMSEQALTRQVTQCDVFAEVEPYQKERLIRALRSTGQLVGYVGDGINDASALHAADVGISVNEAVDVAKEAATIVLLQRDLRVLIDGVREGRVTFANTMKYVFMATSANFGNMFSMAVASVALPFLPLLPKQILLINLLTDLPEMMIANDAVDEELIAQRQRWDLQFIRRFMLVFGALSSVFDLLTFAVLLFLVQADAEQFRTGWFVESVVSACLVVLVVRSRRPFWSSRPGRGLLLASGLVVLLTCVLPWTPLAPLLGFEPLARSTLLWIAPIIATYVASAEVIKRWFFRRATDKPSDDPSPHDRAGDLATDSRYARPHRGG